jgi:hypothetical protein
MYPHNDYSAELSTIQANETERHQLSERKRPFSTFTRLGRLTVAAKESSDFYFKRKVSSVSRNHSFYVPQPGSL